MFHSVCPGTFVLEHRPATATPVAGHVFSSERY